MVNNTGDESLNGETLTMQQQLQRMEERYEAMKEQLEVLQDTMAAMTTGQHTPTASISTLGAGEQTPSLAAASLIRTPEEEKRTARPAQVLPLVSVFSGKPEDYRVWRAEMKGKLAADGEAIGTGHAQCAYIFSRLGSVSKKMMVAYVERDDHQGNPQNFIDYLDSIYNDPCASDKAFTRLAHLRQGPDESVADFLPRFEALLLDSCHRTNDSAAYFTLERTLNQKIKSILARSAVNNHSYKEAKARILLIESQLEEIALSQRK